MNKTKALAERISQHFKDPANRSYPLMLTKERIEAELRNIKNNEEAFWILEEAEGEIKGLCACFVKEDAKYLQTLLFLSFDKNPEFFRKSLDTLMQQYPDFTINAGAEAENQLLVNALKQKHFILSDDLYSASIDPRRAHGKAYPDIEEINASQWKDFKTIHDRHFGDSYWTYDRIKADFSRWTICSLKDGETINAYIFIQCSPGNGICEIFGIYGEEISDRRRLTEHAVYLLKEQKILYYFTEDAKEVKALQKLGFELHGRYQAWEYHPA